MTACTDLAGSQIQNGLDDNVIRKLNSLARVLNTQVIEGRLGSALQCLCS
jgi:hypothetical protein